jgi:NTE family protein
MKMQNYKNIALVLSSGGAKGLAEIGAIKALEEKGFIIKSISGSSIGSLIGGLYAMGKLDDYTQWVKTLNKRAIWGLVDLTIKNKGLLKGDRVFDKMKTFIPDMLIEDMNIPFAAIATDIINEKEIVFDKGSYYEAIRASIAMPGIFTPVKYNRTILVDGGVINPIPIEYVSREKDDILVVVNLYGDKEEEEIEEVKNKEINRTHNSLFNMFSKFITTEDKQSIGYFSLLSITSSNMIHKIAKLNIEKYKPDILINIPYDCANTFDFDKGDELIKLGENAANKAISDYLTNNY